MEPVLPTTMVTAGSLGKYKPKPPTTTQYVILVAALSLYSLGGGYYAATQPEGAGWRFFSWHPMLMTIGMVGLMGIAIVTKKRGGYLNTKIHGILTWLGLVVSFGGLYAIYENKNRWGSKHLQSPHAIAGICVFIGCILLGLVGGMLHPDFGMYKTNKKIRLLHKILARLILLGAWFSCILGFIQLAGEDFSTLAVYALPMVVLVPFTLM